MVSLPKRPQDAPRRPRTSQGRAKRLPKRAKYASRAPLRRAKTATRRPQMPQGGSKTAPRRPKTLPKRGKIQRISGQLSGFRSNLDLGAFWGGFWTVLGWILEGFGMDFGTFFRMDFGRFWNNFKRFVARRTRTKNNMRPQEKQHTLGERSERASAASEASGAIQVL